MPKVVKNTQNHIQLSKQSATIQTQEQPLKTVTVTQNYYKTVNALKTT